MTVQTPLTTQQEPKRFRDTVAPTIPSLALVCPLLSLAGMLKLFDATVWQPISFCPKPGPLPWAIADEQPGRDADTSIARRGTSDMPCKARPRPHRHRRPAPTPSPSPTATPRHPPGSVRLARQMPPPVALAGGEATKEVKDAAEAAAAKAGECPERAACKSHTCELDHPPKEINGNNFTIQGLRVCLPFLHWCSIQFPSLLVPPCVIGDRQGGVG